MNCHDFQNTMVINIFGKLTSSEKNELEGHLRECRKCTRFYQKYKSVVGITETIEEPPLPDWGNSWSRISDRTFKKKPVKPIFLPSPKFAIAGAALVIVFVIGFLTGRQYFQRHSHEYTFLSEADHRKLSPIQSYAESAELFLIDFINRSRQTKEKEIVKFEEQIISAMLIQTQLLKFVISQHDEPYQQDLLEDLELLLVSMSNLRPGDKDAAYQLHQFIREEELLSRLRRLSDQPWI